MPIPHLPLVFILDWEAKYIKAQQILQKNAVTSIGFIFDTDNKHLLLVPWYLSNDQ